MSFINFSRGVNQWYFNSGLRDILFQGQIYTPVPIQRSAINQSKELNRANILLTVTCDFPVIESFIKFPPTQIMTLEIFRRHREDIDNEFATIWNGRVMQVEWKKQRAEITCESAFTSIRRPGIHRHYQATCAHVLYGNQCRANQLSFKDTDTVSGISGNNLTIIIAGTRANGYCAGGFLDVTLLSGINEKRMIKSHTGTTVSLMAPIDDLSVGQSVDIFAGCKYNLDDRENKFSNLDNYGGFPFLPPFTPFGGTTIF